MSKTSINFINFSKKKNVKKNYKLIQYQSFGS